VNVTSEIPLRILIEAALPVGEGHRRYVQYVLESPILGLCIRLINTESGQDSLELVATDINPTLTVFSFFYFPLQR
jgi:hypothetical protein